MKNVSAFLVALLVVALPMSAMAMEGMDHGKMEHDKMEGMEHGKMEHGEHGKMEHGEHGKMSHDGMIMLGDDVKSGVKGMAHLKDVGEAMAKMGMKETHHFMIMFTDVESGEAIESGSVAVKIKDPSEKEAKPVKLMGMQGHFGADISLSEKGTYHFRVGTKLKDGKKRQYHYHYTVE